MSEPKLPHCADCGRRDCRVVGYNVQSEDGWFIRHVWLCASCEYLRAKPDAPRAVRMPRERRAAPLQRETLF